jgi:methionyl-tRNA formyltransferase
MTKIKKVLFIGSKPFGLRCFEEMYKIDPQSAIGLVTIDDRMDTRSAFDSFHEFAGRANLKICVAKNRTESEHIIREFQPELCLVNGWYWLIGKDTLESVPHGFIGIHNSLLPKYRGGSPLVWSIINGETRAGLSFFSFTAGMDDGDIWAQESVPIEPADYISDILKKIEGKAISIIQEKYLRILNGQLRPTPQIHNAATFCGSRIPADGLINWGKGAGEIYDFIRAQSEPYPGAFTILDSKTLIIWRARLLEITYYGSPGQVARITEDGVYVNCGDNKAILLETVEIDGQKGPGSKLIKSIKTRF